MIAFAHWLALFLAPFAHGVDLPLESGAETVWLYVGCYGAERGGTPEQTPRACYQAQGWTIVEQRTLLVAPERELWLNEYVVADGALVRVSGETSEDLAVIRSQLLAFGLRLDRELDGHWPVEGEPVPGA